MPLKKAFQVKVDLSIQTVSCPGVWLCPNGKVSLQIYMLDSCVQTSSVEPSFPLVFQEKFVFCKKFFAPQKLNDLQRVFNKESLYVELIQWQNFKDGNVLAFFRTSLGELLYPASKKNCLIGSEIDLLMEPMKNFPGILAPKIEVSTKTTIEDVLSKDTDCNSYVVNPHTISSAFCNDAFVKSKKFARQKPVCHTLKYHRSTSCNCPSNQRMKQVPNLHNNDIEEEISPLTTKRTIKTCVPCCKDLNPKNPQCVQRNSCSCGCDHQENCPICAKYKYYFENQRNIKSKKNNCQPEQCDCLHVNNGNQGNQMNNETRAEYQGTNESHVTKGQEQNVCPACTDLKLCNYPPMNEANCQLSLLARRIHNRLSESLNQCMSYRSSASCNCGCDEAEECVNSLHDVDCTPKNFGEMYRQLYSSLKQC